MQIESAPDAPPPTISACWYLPCQESPPFLIPQNQILGSGSCPSEVCQQVNNIIGNEGSQIDFNVAQESISCSLTSPTAATGGGGGDPSYIPTLWDQYHTAIIIGGFILIVLVVVVIIIALISSSKSKKKTKPPPTTVPTKSLPPFTTQTTQK